MAAFEAWLRSTSLGLLGTILIFCLTVAALGGQLLRRRLEHGVEPPSDGHEGYVISAVLGLLALLLSFTFAQAVQRYDTRRALVLDDANTIGTAFLRAGLLEEPHRSQVQSILVRYTENRVKLAQAHPAQATPLLALNDRLVKDYWAAVAAAYPGVRDRPFAVSLLENANHLVDLDASRKMSRRARVPAPVYAVLLVYVVVTAGVLGYVLTGLRGRLSGTVLLVLLTLVLMLIVDIDRPVSGGVQESQAPMIALLADLKAPQVSAASTAPTP